MAYTRYGLTPIEPTGEQRAAGWRQVWEHPSGALALRNPATGRWQVSLDGGWTLAPGWSSSLRAAARRIERKQGEGVNE